MRGLIGIVYLVVGLVVARADGYLGGIEGVGDLLSAVLAVLLWPLVLLGVDIKIGGGGNKRAAALLVAPVMTALAPRAPTGCRGTRTAVWEVGQRADGHGHHARGVSWRRSRSCA